MELIGRADGKCIEMIYILYCNKKIYLIFDITICIAMFICNFYKDYKNIDKMNDG